MNDLFKRPVPLYVGLCLVCLFPILLSNVELWDACYAEMAFLRQDFSIIEPWATKYGWYGAYYAYLLANKLALWTGIPWKVFFNVVTVVSLLGLAREVAWYARNRFGLEAGYGWVAAACIIAFPIWHILVSTSIFINVVCFWLFMAAVRYWFSNRIVSVILFLLSAQLFSVFSLAVGLASAEFLLTADRDNWLGRGARTFIVSLVLLLGFIGLMSVIDVNGKAGDYNTIDPAKFEYLYILFVYCAGMAGLGFLLRLGLKAPDEKRLILRRMLAVTALLFFAVLPYVALGRPMRYFGFGGFTSRHTLLTCVPIALFVAVMIRYLAQVAGLRTARYTTVFLLAASVAVLHQGYSHKAAALVFKDMLVQSFRSIDPPPSGYVGVQAEGYEAPRHVHSYAVNLCLYKAYGRGAWRANGFWRRSMKINRASLEKIYRHSPSGPTNWEVTGDAFTKYGFRLTGYHQEGRFWYWLYYLRSAYAGFEPRLVRLEP